VTIEGRTGKVAADGLYSRDYTEMDWSYLNEGFLWVCEKKMELMHWDDATTIDAVQRPD
jgi:hypothetical protein